jgi:polar amino acid transport system substrate-binding protein
LYGKVVATLLALTTLTACGAAAGEQSQQQPRITASKVDRIAAEVPQAIRDRGTLEVISSVGTVPPLTFYDTDNKTPIGVEEDLASLVSDVLGLKPHVNVASWENVFVGLDSGKYDAGFTNITVTEERKEKYDFATYRLDNVSFEARKGSGWKVTDPADVAGKTIAVSSGTNQEKLLLDWNAQNVSRGLKPVDVKYFQNSSDYYLALQSGRIDAYLGPNPTAAYHAKTSGQTEIVGTVSGAGSALQGQIAATTKKGNGLVQALADALNQVIADGSYCKVLDRWGLANEAVPHSEINPPGLPKS